jgi:hypothetical protein
MAGLEPATHVFFVAAIRGRGADTRTLFVLDILLKIMYIS